MAINKIVYDGNTLIDLTGDTVTPETLAEGATAHNKSGEQIIGTMKGGGLTAEALYPVGSIRMWYDNEDHSGFLGFKWERCLAGKFPVGVNPSEAEFAAIGQQGGEKTHALTVAEARRCMSAGSRGSTGAMTGSRNMTAHPASRTTIYRRMRS